MMFDWPSIANDVATGLILATLLGLLAFAWAGAKAIAAWLAQRAARRLPPLDRSAYDEEWQAEIAVSSRVVAIRFAFGLWWHASAVCEAVGVEPSGSKQEAQRNPAHRPRAGAFLLSVLSTLTGAVATGVFGGFSPFIRDVCESLTRFVLRREIRREVERQARSRVVYDLRAPGGPKRLVLTPERIEEAVELQLMLRMDPDLGILIVRKRREGEPPRSA